MTIIEQYHAAKRTHPNMLLLFRLGDEYQLLDEDAKTAAKLLGLTMTTCETTPMATFPHASLEIQLQKFLQAGHRVAICDQVQGMKTFTKTFEIDEAIGWELYKTNLTLELLDRAANDAGCPQEITESAWTGGVTVKDKQFIVTVTEGEKE